MASEPSFEDYQRAGILLAIVEEQATAPEIELINDTFKRAPAWRRETAPERAKLFLECLKAVLPHERRTLIATEYKLACAVAGIADDIPLN